MPSVTTSTPKPSSWRSAFFDRLSGKAGEDPRSRLNEQDACRRRVDRSEVLAQSVPGHLGDCSRHFHTSGTGTDHQEGDVAATGSLRNLEGFENPGSKPGGIGQGLQTRSVSLPLVVAEVVVGCPGGHDESIELVGARVSVNRTWIDVADGVLDDTNVLLPAQDVSDRRCDVCGR